MSAPLPSTTVKTRNLMLLALACGTAIMAAGAVFFFQLATQDDPEPAAAVGERVEVGDMVVTVSDAVERDGVLTVDVVIGGTVDDDPSDEFRLIAAARPVAVMSSTCAASGLEPERCTVAFDVTTADGSSRVLFYERGDDRARWVIE